MPKVRRMPNGDRVRFPDEDTEEDIQRWILKHFPPQDPDMLESTGEGDDIYFKWMKHLEQTRPPEDPQRQMMLRALEEYNKELGRKDIPPRPQPPVSTVI